MMRSTLKIRLTRPVLLNVTMGLFLFITTILSSGFLHGDKTQKEPAFEDILKMSLEELTEITVTVASKSSEKVDDAPSSVTVFTGETIRQMGITHLEELLAFVPGFQVSRDVEQGTAFRIAARGRGTALSESVLLLLDGQRLNDLYNGGVSILNRYIAVENIRQVEIIRGPGSALYGSNAFMGVINIVTMDKGNNASVKAGTAGYKNAVLNISKKLSPSLRVSLFSKVFSDKGFQYQNVEDILGTFNDTKDPVKGLDAQLKIQYKDFSLRIRHMERDLRNFMVYSTVGNGVNREHVAQTSLSLGYQKKLSKKLELKVRFFALTDNLEIFVLVFPSGTEVEPGFVLQQQLVGGPVLDSFNTSLEAEAVYRLSAANTLIMGATYTATGTTRVIHQYTHHPLTLEYTGEITQFTGDLGFNEIKTRKVLGLYIQDKQTVGKRLSVTAGLRYDRYSDFGGTLNPRASIIYTAPWGSKLKAMYGRAFRSPNYLELYDKNNPVDFGNPNLDPEKLETLEFAYIHSFKSVYAALTYFHVNIRDIIVLGTPIVHPNNPLGVPSFSNSGRLTTQGLEFELKASPFKNVIMTGTFTHYFQEDPIPVSRDSATFIINYNTKSFNLNLNGVYLGKNTYLPVQDPYILINAAVSFRLTKGIRLTGSVKNLFDVDYFTVSALLPNGVQNRGRSILVGLDFDL